MIPIDTIRGMRERIAELERNRDDDNAMIEKCAALAGWLHDEGFGVRGGQFVTIRAQEVITSMREERDAARADLAKARGRAVRLREVIEAECVLYHDAGVALAAECLEPGPVLLNVAKQFCAILGPASPAPPEPETDGGLTCDPMWDAMIAAKQRQQDGGGDE